MSAPDSTVFQHNFKVWDSLHNIYATSGTEDEELLDYFQENLLSKIVAIQQGINGATNVAVALPVAPAARQPGPPAPGPAAAPQVDGEHVCDCGMPMRFVPAGVSKTSGKPYRAFYACAGPRGQQCQKKITV